MLVTTHAIVVIVVATATTAISIDMCVVGVAPPGITVVAIVVGGVCGSSVGIAIIAVIAAAIVAAVSFVNFPTFFYVVPVILRPHATKTTAVVRDPTRTFPRHFS